MKDIVVQRIRQITDPNSGNEPERLCIHILGRAAQDQFKYLLDRALNTAPPHLSNFQDWFELADVLEGRTEQKGPAHV